MALWVLAGKWLKNISRHIMHTSIAGDKYGKSLYIGPVHLYGVYRAVTLQDCCPMLGRQDKV